VKDPSKAAENRLLFYGRRKGRKLRTARAIALTELLPRFELVLDSEPLDPQALFPDAQEIHLEIGFGNGEHLLALAQRQPDIGFIGCEPFSPGVSMLAQAATEAGVQNLRIFPDDARRLLDVLTQASIARCYILFADPWPKKRHAFRRFINPDNLARLARVLRSGGKICLATDDPGLAKWYEQQFVESFFSLRVFSARPTPWPQTRYEQKAAAVGRPSRYYEATRPEACTELLA
jgi:tRNA (guanine-N7-)-methyltransferase